jgi:hypothetical protein
LAQQVAAAHFSRWREHCSDERRPPVTLLTGLPRSGTTLLERILDAHSQVVSCDELDAFPRLILPLMLAGRPPEQFTVEVLDSLPADRLRRQRFLYCRLLRAALGHPVGGRMLIDKNPSLLPLLAVYRRLIPDCRLIIALRDPRDALVSCLMAYFPLNDFSVDFLAPESAAERIAADLQIWIRLREQIGEGWCEVRYEAVLDDFKGEAARTLSSLGLAWEDNVLQYRDAGRDRPINSPSYDTVAQPIYTHARGRWRNYADFLEPVLPRLEPAIAALGYG